MNYEINMTEFNVVIEKGEDGYLISEVMEIPGCHTQAKTMDELIKRVREVIELCLEDEKPQKTEFLGVQIVKV